MVRDPRYRAVCSLIKGNEISTIKEIFEVLPRTVLARDLRQNYAQFAAKIRNPTRFTVLDVFRMASWIQVEPEQLVTLMKQEVMAKLAKRKKPKPKV